jgi:hypothetical protein
MIDSLFQFHKLNEVGIERAQQIAEKFSELLVSLEYLCPASREFSIVKTKLEEAAFFAKKSIANVAENQVQ